MTKIDNGKKLIALESLFQGDPVTVAAEKAGISQRTLLRWAESDKEFIAASRRIQARVLAGIVRRLLGLASKALNSLESILDNPKQPGAHAKRLAARDVLSLLREYTETVDHEERIAELEALVSGRDK